MEVHQLEKKGGRDSSFPNMSVVLLGIVFLLFPIAHLPIFGLPLYLSEVALLASIVLFLKKNSIHSLFLEFRKIFSQEKLLFLSVALFFLGIVTAFLVNPHEMSGWGKLKSFYVVPIVLFFSLLFMVQTKEDFLWITKHWFLGILAASGAGLWIASEGIFLYDGRLSGPYQSANYLALLVAPGVILGIFLLLVSRPWKAQSLLLLGIGFSALALFLTRSYATWCAVIVSSLTLSGLILAKKRAIQWIFPAFFIGIIIFATLFALESDSEKGQQLFSLSERSSLASRMIIWQVGTEIALDHFPFGIGTARFQEIYLSYQPHYPPYLEWAVPTPHNLPLHFLLEGGVMALMGWIGVLVSILWSFWMRWRAILPTDEALPYVALGISLVAFYFVYGLVDTPYMKNDLTLALWGSLGLFLVSLRFRA